MNSPSMEDNLRARFWHSSDTEGWQELKPVTSPYIQAAEHM